MNTDHASTSLSTGLGNVLTTISDRKKRIAGENPAFEAVIETAQDYYPFGSLMPGRKYNPAEYRFGFNGQEKDDEITGVTGSHLTFKYRIHDSRLGRFLSIDPLYKDYQFQSPYVFSQNRVIDGVELEGKEYVHYFVFMDKDVSIINKVIAEDFRNMSSKQIQLAHGMSGPEFYKEYSQSFGPEGRGVKYTYFTDFGSDGFYQTGVPENFIKDNVFYKHGIYYGPGCPTEKGPRFEHIKGVNDYNYSLDPIDEVDELARRHDIGYDFEGYGDKAGWLLPASLTDYQTIDVDKEFVQGLKDYKDRASKDGYIDKRTGKPPSKEALEAAETGIKWFERIIEYKENRKQRDEND